MSKPHYIYIYIKPWDGQICYVGKSCKKNRILDHYKIGEFHQNKHFANIFKKAKRLGLEICYKKICEGLSEEEANLMERYLISLIGRQKNGGTLVNLTDGGEGTTGLEFSEERKSIHRQKQKQLWENEEYKKKMLSKLNTPEMRMEISSRTKKMWQENREALSENLRGRKKKVDHDKASATAKIRSKLLWKGQMSFVGQHHTDESKNKISKANKGRIKSKEWRDRISLGKKKAMSDPEYKNPHIGMKRSPEARQRMSEAQYRRQQREREEKHVQS